MAALYKSSDFKILESNTSFKLKKINKDKQFQAPCFPKLIEINTAQKYKMKQNKTVFRRSKMRVCKNSLSTNDWPSA